MLVVLCTFPDLETARRVVTTLVTEQLAACFNLVPGAESVYVWEGKLETSAEVLALGKTTEAAWPVLRERLKELHPYEVPEILALPVESGLPEYLKWVEGSVKP